MYFISREGTLLKDIQLGKRVNNLDVYGDLFFITQTEDKDIPVYKVSRIVDHDITKSISIDYLSTFTFEDEIIEFDTKGSDQAMIFTGENEIQVWQIDSPYRKEFVRKLPFFKYEDHMVFYVNEDELKIVFARVERFLYVIMVNKENKRDKKLFCFNMLKSSHDALYSVIPLDEKLTDLSNRIFIESNQFESTIYIYLFYGGRTYQLIKFEPENLLKKTEKNNQELFLPSNHSELKRFPLGEVTMMLYPRYDDYMPSQNTSIILNVHSRNHGLKIETTIDDENTYYHNKNGEAVISLLDFFNGFNNTFSISYKSKRDEKYTDFEIATDISTTYLLEGVSKAQRVIFSMEFEDHVLVFYEEKGLLQVYNIENGITKINKEFNYHQKFGN
jgi:hypothetical protein